MCLNFLIHYTLYLDDITTDLVPPISTSSVPANGATLTEQISEISVTFNEEILPSSATNTANYMLYEAGTDGAFNTRTCSVAANGGDDLSIAIASATYDNPSLTSTLHITPSLDSGTYRLYVCGTTSIIDIAGNELNGGASDTTYNFSITTAASSLPSTGFRHGEVTSLPNQPAAKAYTDSAMTLEIPKLGVSMPIVGVPQSGSEWDVTWLGNSAGYLAGSAFPTWAGNTVITGHVWDAYNQPGAFAELKNLEYGDQVQIHAWGQIYTYEVRESSLVTKKNTNAVFQSEQYDWLTLVTCEFYNPFSGEYLFRRAVRAVLVSVQ